MGSFLRKVRAIVGNALTWGLGWALVGAVPGALLLILFPFMREQALQVVGGVMLLFGAAGAVSGTVFSGILRVVYGRRRLDELRALRVGAWTTGGTVLVALGALRFFSAVGAVFTPRMTLATLLTAGGLGFVTAAGATKIAQGSGAAELEPGGEDEAALP